MFSSKMKRWWRRDKPAEYTPILSKDNGDVKTFLRHHEFILVSDLHSTLRTRCLLIFVYWMIEFKTRINHCNKINDLTYSNSCSNITKYSNETT